MSEVIIPICIGCKKRPDEIQEYITEAEEEEMTPDEYVRLEEDTYNPSNGHFLCSPCYVDWGMPTQPGGWKAP